MNDPDLTPKKETAEDMLARWALATFKRGSFLGDAAASWLSGHSDDVAAIAIASAYEGWCAAGGKP